MYNKKFFMRILLVVSSLLLLTVTGCSKSEESRTENKVLSETFKSEESRIENQVLCETADSTDSDSEKKFYEDEGYSEVQPENAGSYEILDKAHSAVDKQLKKTVAKSEDYDKVYKTLSTLIYAMSDYLTEVTYGEPYYSMMPLQINNDIRQWYESLLPYADTDYRIICGDKATVAGGTGNMTHGEMDNILGQYKPRKPESAKGKWNRIRSAFARWQDSRAEFAGNLPSDRRKSFDENTCAMAYYLFKEIRGLQETRNDNVIYFSEHPEEL